MKIKNNTKNEVKALKDLYKVGDVLKVNEIFFDGRTYENIPHYVTVTKVNKVTVYGTEGKGGDVILDLTDLMYAQKVIQREILAWVFLQSTLYWSYEK